MSATIVALLLLVITVAPGGAATIEHAASVTGGRGSRERATQQGVVAQEATSVTLILKEDFSRPGLAAVVRATAEGANIIGFKRAALTPELLSAALTSLSRARLKLGERPDRRIDIRIREGMRLRAVSPADRVALERIIAELRSAARRRIPGIGEVPAITVRL
jgi:hypothetical protein